MNRKKIIFIFMCALFSIKSIASNINTFAIKDITFGTGYDINTVVPSIVNEGSIINIGITSKHSSSFITSATLIRTEGSVCGNRQMYLNDIIAVPRVAIFNNGLELKYIGYEGPVSNEVNMNDGFIGLSSTNPTPNSCKYYENYINKPNNYYGTGHRIFAKYKVVKLGDPGPFSLHMKGLVYFTRTDSKSGVVNIGSLKSVENIIDYNLRGSITNWCKIHDYDLELDHGQLTIPEINGNIKQGNIFLECGGGSDGLAEVHFINNSDTIDLDLGNGISSSVSLPKDNIIVPVNGRVGVTVTSTLKKSGKKIKEGNFSNNTVVIINWL